MNRPDGYEQHLRAQPDLNLADIGYTLATTRTHFTHRAVIIGREHDEFLTALDALAQDIPAANLVTGTATDTPIRPVFVYPGQGTHWTGMATELLHTSPVFRDSIHATAHALAPHTDWSLLDILDPPTGTGTGPATGTELLLQRVDILQPTVFAVMTALTALWESVGVHPAAVIGHSQGEIAAAHTAAALTLPDAAAIITRRAKTLTTLADTGAMASIQLPADHTTTLLEPFPNQVWIAAINSPHTTVIAGNPDTITTILTHCEHDNIRTRLLPVNYASHTPHITNLHTTLTALLADITPHPSNIPFYSTLTSHLHDTTELDAEYWYRNLRNPVQFHNTLHTLITAGHHHYLEISPHPTLTTAIHDTLEQTGTPPAPPPAPSAETNPAGHNSSPP